MESFYFYDLETSGLNPRDDRIMQFAGQRTDKDFNLIGEPDNILVKLADDTLPSPGAIMVTGITPQSTLADGLTEHEFCEFFLDQVATPGTTIMGYNSVRFDDEFIRATFWRNFYDPYEWQWKDGRSRWDLLDVVRLTRALRPDGINWPMTDDGRATNRLELLTKCNHITHAHAHDALSDVMALIAITKLIHDKQPQLFSYLYKMRDKRQVQQLVNLETPQPFVYASGRYPSEFEKATVAIPLAPAPNGNVLVYDLRYNLEELLKADAQLFPIVKTLQYNRCPAVAPLGVLEKDDGWNRLQLTKDQIEQNLKTLRRHPDFAERMRTQVEEEKSQPRESIDPESAIYDGFLNDRDRILCSAVRNNDADKLANFHPEFIDERLPGLLLHYKARNFPTALAEDEQKLWEEYRTARLNRQAPKFLAEVQDIQQKLATNQSFGTKSPDECAFLLEELLLWYQSLQDGDY